MKDFTKNILEDIKVDLAQAFDRNFEKKAFFDKGWDKVTKIQNHRGSLMERSNKLRRSINAKSDDKSIHFSSNMPYAQIHNEGGKITVTAKMKRYFWAKYREASKAQKYMGKKRNSYSIKKYYESQNAQMWKALALKKVGDTITIPQRQFIGFEHPEVHRIIKENIDYNIQEVNKKIKEQFKVKR